MTTEQRERTRKLVAVLAGNVIGLLGEPPVVKVLAHEGVVALYELPHELVRVGGHDCVSLTKRKRGAQIFTIAEPQI